MSESLILEQIDELRRKLAPDLRSTPTIATPALAPDSDTTVITKFELWQLTGSFKARGALANIQSLNAQQRAAGVTAVSAGNHAIATAFAAARLGVSAKVVMTASAPELRVQRAEAYGATVERAGDVHAAFVRVAEIVADEGRAMIHPFEGRLTATATAGVGRELMIDGGPLDAVIVPVGGGGLAAGVAAAVKLTDPDCKVYGVEPFGADSMYRSFAAGTPQQLERVDTIADSLGAPMALPVSFALCERYIDEIVRVDDAALVAAMRRIYATLAMAVEPACAAGVAALHGPLLERLQGKRVGLIFCGSNIDMDSWYHLVAER